MHSQVQVRSGTAAGRADHADLLTRTYRVALLNRCFLQMTVQRSVTVAMVYLNIIAVALRVSADSDNFTAANAVRRLTVQIAACAANVDAVMVGAAVAC